MPETSADSTCLIRQDFALFEEFAEATIGWELDFCQLGRSRGTFFLEQLVGSSVLVSRAYFPSGFYQLGGATPGCRTISILAPAREPSNWRWCGETVTRSSLLVMPVGGEFESVSMPGLDTIHLAIPIPLLEQVAESQFRKSLYELMPDERCFCANGGEPLVRLRHLLAGLTIGPGGAGRTPLCTVTPALERELAWLVLACLDRGNTAAPRGAQGKRRRVLADALDIVGTKGPQSVGVAQLVSELGVSRRTLENVFRDGLDIAPAAYLKALRLQQLSRALLRADSRSNSVAMVAGELGFRHLGQLASDYRSMFGELPSATLRRCQARHAQ